MSSLQIPLLGGIAGLTIFLGLPVGRLSRPVPRLKAALNAAGSMLYVFIELLAVARTSRLKELTTWCILSGLGLGFLTDGILVATGA